MLDWVLNMSLDSCTSFLYKRPDFQPQVATKTLGHSRCVSLPIQTRTPFLKKYLRWVFVKRSSVDMKSRNLKGCVRYIFASLFLVLNGSTCQIKKNVFYFTSKPLFVLEKIKF